MRRRFFWALVMVALVTLTMGGLAAALLFNRSVEESARSEFTRQAEATARLIEVGVRERGWGQGQLRALGSILGVVAAVGGHDYVEAVFVGPAGGMTVVGEEAPVAAQVPGGAASVTQRVQFEAEVDGEAVAAFALPVVVGNLGTVVVVIGTDLDLVPWPPVAARLLWAVGLGVLLAALLAGWLSRFLGKRLDGLSSASRRIAEGDLGARVEVEGSDEIAQVGLAFNEMAGQLEEARVRERGFLAAVGHDLRTPLTTIAGYAEALEEGKVAPDDLPRVSRVIHRESGRLSRLLEDLMLLSRLEAGEFQLRPEQVELAGHLGGSVEAYRGRAEAAGVRLEVDLGEAPPMAVDPDRIDQVVGNLVENALRYTPQGGTVRLTLSSQGAGVRISVSDTGPGIEPADLPHIFERLYVAQRYRPARPEGSGLGLAIVKELAEAMGGTAGVSSDPGRGTTVSVTLPPAPPGP
ncbi:MAG TPA: HAMP domain-containing sensor histidine kinase [Acidimicrobiia bacterium]|nr:HAMP domain-containing sensor histidine kinase [Acidimicrobiia bacterium]